MILPILIVTVTLWLTHPPVSGAGGPALAADAAAVPDDLGVDLLAEVFVVRVLDLERGAHQGEHGKGVLGLGRAQLEAAGDEKKIGYE